MKTVNTFNEQFTYLLAFAAALVGISAFKQELSSSRIELFNHSYTWLSITVPMTAGILFAAYIAALAIQAKNYLPITRFPIVKYMEILASSIALLGLLYPMGVGVAWSLSKLYELIQLNSSLNFEPKTQSILLGLTIGIQTALGAFVSYAFAKRKNAKRRYEHLLINEIKIDNELEDTVKSSQVISDTDALEKYMLLVSRARNLLYGLGYDVQIQSLDNIAHVFKRMNIFDKKDIDKVAELRKIKHYYSRNQKKLTKSDIEYLTKIIDQLDKKISDRIKIELTAGEKSAS